MLEMDEPIIHQDISYLTVENFFQAMKTHKDNINLRIKLAAMSPYDAKRLAKKISLRPDWEAIKIEVMRTAIKHKFKKGTKWHENLTKNPEPIIERNNWHDNFWGDCLCEKCESKLGLNWLGKLIEEQR